ncbi:pilus assembly protein CpaF [Tissierella praeacuta DSM 18095]|uniref:Pilus assembly protein CpaF n=1 Tax=Tissierella praeacuta DSM 18095 TaxID=1123404 RepID=A0A1M4XJB4_9FIRM|nr:CpaF family protein [Tissierella praeacuta]TCU67841.1 pilus assembly protein CpaF [Tissierella praeacuta]SHE93500.1 pilus assembly protein CpaF [Tissierella praeacuta DSM 18095]SUP02072.1 Pertussis toxin liberation protein H [Tissierella praeacuta]
MVRLSERLEKAKKSEVTGGVMPEMMGFTVDTIQVDQYESLKLSVHRDVIDTYNKQIQDNNGDAEGIDVKAIIHDMLILKGESLTKAKRETLIQEIYDDVMGLGPLEPILREDDISEIMVNGPKDVYIERKGKIEFSGVFFRDEAHVLQIINRIVSPLGRQCDEANPMVDARLRDGSRVNAVVPPIALNGPTLTIRKFNSIPLQISDMIEYKSLSFQMASFLEACVKGRCNIMVSGGTGSGKTTLLNVLSSFIPENERIVTIEDAAELKLMQRHVITLESRPSNVEGKGQVSIRDLVRNSLRMRPDRIIVGEVRSGEALDMLQAMNTGHDGSLATAHANTARDLIARLETMVMMSGMDLPVRAIREQIASAIDIVVQQSRFRDGSRKITAISEVTGMEGDIVTLQDIFVYKQEGYDVTGMINGKYEPTGIRPYVVDKLKDNGVFVKDEWFMK